MSKTKTISARVPLDIAKMVEDSCKHRGLNKSQFLTEIITSAPSKQDIVRLKMGGSVANTSAEKLPKEIRGVLAASGGLGVGLLVHNVLNKYLPAEKVGGEEAKEDIMLLVSIAVGVGAMVGLSSMLKKGFK